jgi:hypothetical protein
MRVAKRVGSILLAWSVLALVISAAACTSGLRAQNISSNVPQKIIAPRLTSLAESGDSIALASLIRSSCKPVAQKGECYERYLVIPAAAGRVRVAMGALGALASSEPNVARSGHQYAHAIGTAAGKPHSDIAATFSQCSESFQSGCYHGLIQAWFAGLDTLTATDANELCAPFRKSETDRWIRFQCVHGMGHGLTMLYNHDLPLGLAGCDLLREWWDRHSCYSGAFMENVVNVSMPHHRAAANSADKTAGSKAAEHSHDVMAGMSHEMADMHHEDAATVFKPVDPADQQYPCSKLPERYLTACYEMQTSVMLLNNHGDIAGAARSCDAAPVAMITICYASLGRDISSYSAQNHKDAIRMCSLGTARFEPWCYYGLVKNFIDLNARSTDGISLCRDVTGSANKSICYSAVGEQVMLLSATAEGRRAMCAQAEPEYVDACLYSARVTDRAPPALLEIWRSVRVETRN